MSVIVNMKLFYEKLIFFCTNVRKDKEYVSSVKHKSLVLGNYIKKRFKELAIKKVGVASLECLNRHKLGLVPTSYPEGYWYKTSSKEDVDFFIDKSLIKKKTFKKNFIEN